VAAKAKIHLFQFLLELHECLMKELDGANPGNFETISGVSNSNVGEELAKMADWINGNLHSSHLDSISLAALAHFYLVCKYCYYFHILLQFGVGTNIVKRF
jgi:hypothetical protein